ncbi:N-formylglutamate amidohydrolase [Allohahella sp. A8]|uniref:N-formylglutamate amidohydrolase n=1 Tax=Allohahella sp. A8 TaxID=3141461 RepID=UPI000C09D0B5|nr:N-formylglutamate amidohydrolase [Hahellaceae bacterium]|tara:strand:+ start:135245 stop:136051 length:807 start_codon:yes stop_codon:yes gene_type:complete
MSIPAGRIAPQVIRPEAGSQILLVCEHASNFIPDQYHGLGLNDAVLQSHVAWDPGALEVARHLSELLDARLIASAVSRLVYDCNRPPHALDAMPARSEIHDIPGNANLGDAERASRVASVYKPFKKQLKTTLQSMSGTPIIITIHSFTPVYKGQQRTVEIGILHDRDSRLADALLQIAQQNCERIVRRNQPYGPKDGVTHTLKAHALPSHYLNVMIEIRNDLIATPHDQEAMALMLSGLLTAAIKVAQARPVLDEEFSDDEDEPEWGQ